MTATTNKAKRAVVDEDPKNGEIKLKRSPLNEAKKYFAMYTPKKCPVYDVQHG